MGSATKIRGCLWKLWLKIVSQEMFDNTPTSNKHDNWKSPWKSNCKYKYLHSKSIFQRQMLVTKEPGTWNILAITSWMTTPKKHMLKTWFREFSQFEQWKSNSLLGDIFSGDEILPNYVGDHSSFRKNGFSLGIQPTLASHRFKGQGSTPVRRFFSFGTWQLRILFFNGF